MSLSTWTLLTRFLHSSMQSQFPFPLIGLPVSSSGFDLCCFTAMSSPHSLLLKHLHQIRVPQPGEKIYKDECAFSFDTPESETGLFVCMNSFLGFGRENVERHYRKTGNAVYLQMLSRKREVPVEKQKQVEEKKVTRLAIGVEGGFDVEAGKKYEYDEQYNIVILPEFARIPLPNADLPEIVQLAVNRLLSSDSASKVEEAQALAGTWDGEKRPITKHAYTLQQLNNGVLIRPRGWKCEMCDKVDNLWLNLTDGRIFCGRRFFDGSGGNNHAIEHYKMTGNPLAVKLGTITPNTADVFSYDEDEMVEDPNLPEHLAHFGINISQMEKTDKSMIELEIDMNQRIGEWATIQEAGSQLVPLFGPGYTGLTNLGNSCYLNSVMQVIFSIPEFQLRYADLASDIFDKAPGDPINDFNVQMAKLGHGLLSGKYSQAPPSGTQSERDANESQPGIRPTMFKSLIGRGHTEFSTKRQQDAQEYFLHLLNVLERNNRGQLNPADCFKFKGEERIQCLNSGKVKYTHTSEFILRVPIPLEAAINKDQVREYEAKKAAYEANGQRLTDEIVRARIPFSACLEALATPKTVQGFFNTALQANTSVVKTFRMATYPDYLMVQLEKFTFENGWIPKKLDVSIDVPDELDLLLLKGHGLQPGEELIPDDSHAMDTQPEHPPFQMDEIVVAQLVEMGFPVDACRRALFNIGCSDLEAAVTWLTEHIADPDFTAPFIVPGDKASRTASVGNFIPDETALSSIINMGFTPDQATHALKNTDNNVERAIDWIFSHICELEKGDRDSEPSNPQPQFRDGSGRYHLVAFISHMGTSTMVGHYVCHIYKDGRWVIYNDNKVALSENPPKDLGYLYLFQRG